MDEKHQRPKRLRKKYYTKDVGLTIFFILENNMKVEGKVFDIVQISEKVWQVVIKKKRREKFFPIAFLCFSYCIEQIKKQNIQQKDRVVIKYYIKSNVWNGKYHTDAIVDDIVLKIKDAGSLSVFNNEYNVDTETGEIFEP